MAEQIDVLKIRIAGTDLDRYTENEKLLDYALLYAESQINLRRGTDTLEPKFLHNQIEGAADYLAKIGAEGQSGFSENGVSGNYKEVPDWLMSVVPKLGVVR